MKKELLLSSALALSMVAAPMTAFAADFDGESTTTPIQMTVEATPIDVTVSDAITMNVATNATEATISDFVVTNNSQVGVIGISNMTVTSKNAWTKVADTTDFAKLNMDAKQFSMVYDGHDLNTDYTTLQTVDPTTSKTMKLSGQSGPVKTAVANEVVADMILTIAYQ